MPDLSRNPDDYDDHDAYAHAQAINARHSDDAQRFAVGGTDGTTIEAEYAVEPSPGTDARATDDEMAGPIEDLPLYQHGARIITRTVTYSPWRYVTPDEIEHEVNRHA